MKRKTLPILGVAVGMLLLSACGGSSQPLPNSQSLQEGTNPPAAAAQELEREVSFDLSFSAILQKEDQPVGYNDFTVKALSAGILTGTMQVENVDNGEIESHNWTIRVDENAFGSAESLKTIAVKPGNYVFSLLVDRGAQQYAGTTFHYVFDGSTDHVPMTIRPVIGDSLVDVAIVENLIDFRFSYSPTEIDAAGLIDPGMAIVVSGVPEQYFVLNPATGLSEYMFMNLIPGNYDIALKLFDGGAQVGRSVAQQEIAVSVTAGLDVNMDIEPLYGEMGFDLFVEGEDAIVSVQVPAEVVDEVGDLANLDTILRVTGPNAPFNESLLNLQPAGPVYTADVMLPQMQYGELTFEMLFIDVSRGEEIGNCINNATLSGAATTIECPLTLQRRSVIGGSLMSALGVNVFDANGDPVPGAVVSVGGEEVGITASAQFSTPGYTKTNVKPGQYTVRADLGPEFGEVIYDSVPLNVANIDVVIGETGGEVVLLADDFNGNQSGTASPSSYWFGCLAKGPYQGYIGSGILYLGSRFNNTNNDWCWSTSVLTDYSFTDQSITDAGGFIVSVDVASAAAVNSVVTIGIGEEAGSDPLNFYPHLTADAIVNVRDNEIQVVLYDSGNVVLNNTFPTPIAAQFIENVSLEVITDSFGPEAPATLIVSVNDDPEFAPPIDFTWDGGSNHIEVKGTAGVATNGGGINYVEYDGVTISTR